VTLLSQTHVRNEVYAEVRAQFEEKEIVCPCWSLAVIR
jgi:hypothetical protein